MILVALVLLACVVVGWGYAPEAPLQEAFLGFLVGLIGGLFVSVARVVLDVIRVIGPIFQTVWNGINAVIGRIGENAGRFFRAIAGGARALYDSVLRPVVAAVVSGFGKFAEFLDRVTAPIREAFEWVNRVLDTVWTKVIAPILDVIEKVRAVLQVLAELGVPFAQQLADLLRILETRIFEAFREVRTFVNDLFGFIDVLFDPRGWIRSTPFLNTIWHYGGNILNLLALLGIDPLASDRVQAFREEHATPDLLDVVRRAAAGEFAQHPSVQLAAARFRTRSAGLG